jgi:hypothetical protein
MLLKNNSKLLFFVLVASASTAFTVPMYNAAQFATPMNQPNAFLQQTEAQQKLQEAFSPQVMTSVMDPNSNQFHPTTASQFSMPTMPQIQTFDAYPQVQTQGMPLKINLQGMPPITVNTSRIDPSQYS